MNSYRISPRKSEIMASTIGVIGSGFLWLICFKLVASWLGPEGVGLFSQLRQMIQAATIAATFGGSNTIVQGISVLSDESARKQFRSSVANLIGLTGTLIVVGFIATAPWLANFFFASSVLNFVTAIYWMSLAIALSIASTYTLAVHNGYRSYFQLAVAQISGPAILTILLLACWWRGFVFNPTLLAQCFVLCFGIAFVMGARGIARDLPSSNEGSWLVHDENWRAFLRFAGANLLTALSATAAMLLIRSWIIDEHGLAFAGLFDAGWTLTFNYATIFLSACNVIYLPTLTAVVDSKHQKDCVLRMAYLVLATFVLVLYILLIFKEALVSLLYSPQFHPSTAVLNILGIAVLFRAVSWVYGTLLVATRQPLTLLISEVALNVSLLVATRFALDRDLTTLEGLSWSFVLPHFLYLIFSIEYANSKNKLLRRIDIWPLLLSATLPLLFFEYFQNSTDSSNINLSQYFFAACGLATIGAALLGIILNKRQNNKS